MHYIEVMEYGGGSGWVPTLVAAKDVRVGMKVQVDSRGSRVWSVVTVVGTETRQGLYNPSTTSHTLMVNNVSSLVSEL